MLLHLDFQKDSLVKSLLQLIFTNDHIEANLINHSATAISLKIMNVTVITKQYKNVIDLKPVN